MDDNLLYRLLPDTITGHILNDPRFDFDPTSPCNVKENYRRLGIRLDDAMAMAISIGMRQQLRKECHHTV